MVIEILCERGQRLSINLSLCCGLVQYVETEDSSLTLTLKSKVRSQGVVIPAPINILQLFQLSYFMYLMLFTLPTMAASADSVIASHTHAVMTHLSNCATHIDQ